MNYLSYDDPGEDLRGYGGARNWDSALEFLGGVLEQSDYWHMERWGTSQILRLVPGQQYEIPT